MDALKHYAKGVWVDKHLAQWVTIIMMMGNTGLAMAVFAGGLVRFSVPSYDPLVDYTNGNVWIWGVWIFVAAILMGVPSRSLNIIGLWAGMFWHIFWMSCFTIAVTNFETAAATPIAAYGTLAMIHTALLTARVIDKSGG